MSAHTALPFEVVEVDNEGDYGSGGPDCKSGFKSFAIADENGRVLFDSLNRDPHHCEVEEDLDEDSVYAFDRLAKQDAEFIVRACNAHDDLVHELICALPFLEDMQSDPGYKNGAVANRIKSVRVALAKAGAI